MEVLAAVYPQEVFNDPQSWPRARRLDVARVGGDCIRTGTRGAGRQPARLARVIPAWGTRGLCTGPAALRARLGDLRAGVGPDTPIRQRASTTLLCCSETYTIPKELRRLYERALSICDNMTDHDAIIEATILNSFANLCHDQNSLEEARSFYQRALAIRKDKLEDHFDTATTLNDLGLLFLDLFKDRGDLGDLQEAQRLLEF